LKANGVNLVRLRLWHSTEEIYNSLASVVNYAKKVKQHNMDILLDFHYSDTWADPGNQTIPAAWQNLDFEILNDSIFGYTRYVMQRFADEDVLPVIVQVGNETNSGFLWDEGRVGGQFDNNWSDYIQLVNRAISAVRQFESKNKIRIMLHFAGLTGATWYFDNLTTNQVDFDVIGLSYYSIWHGTDFGVLQSQLTEISSRYSNEIMIVETAYPWTLEWNDWTNNIYGLESQLIPEYSATPEGQKQFMMDLDQTIKNLGDKGIGYCYWAPDFVAFKGSQSEDGSPWENVTIFDFDNQVLPVIQVFNEN
jgi:arabinogalactan endo-1,4-beta-galactosidase